VGPVDTDPMVTYNSTHAAFGYRDPEAGTSSRVPESFQMKKLILSLMALAITAHAQSENDLLRSLSRADRNLNRIWNEKLTPAEREELRADERKWALWKDGLPLEQKEQAVWARVDFLDKFIHSHGR
jgi:hypothetical protein